MEMGNEHLNLNNEGFPPDVFTKDIPVYAIHPSNEDMFTQN